jgi:hypothetical protein
MAEFYPEDILRTSRRLFDEVSAWGSKRGDVTLIGGWAVHELVNPMFAQQSRDVDLVMHTQDALMAFDALLPQLGLQWRAKGRNTFNDCHIMGDAAHEIVVDVFKGTDFPDVIFRGLKARRGLIVKPWPERTFLPKVASLVRDKLETIPNRQRDVSSTSSTSTRSCSTTGPPWSPLPSPSKPPNPFGNEPFRSSQRRAPSTRPEAAGSPDRSTNSSAGCSPEAGFRARPSPRTMMAENLSQFMPRASATRTPVVCSRALPGRASIGPILKCGA